MNYDQIVKKVTHLCKKYDYKVLGVTLNREDFNTIVQYHVQSTSVGKTYSGIMKYLHFKLDRKRFNNSGICPVFIPSIKKSITCVRSDTFDYNLIV